MVGLSIETAATGSRGVAMIARGPLRRVWSRGLKSYWLKTGSQPPKSWAKGGAR